MTETFAIYRGRPMQINHKGSFNYADKKLIPMQYTGLKDKNGKEIYEGDIIISSYNKTLLWEVYIGNCVAQVNGDEYVVNYAGVGFRHIKNKDYELEQKDDFWYYESKIEVVGNIYENPELLK